MKKRLLFVFVHGLSGWGSYDASYEKMPYWGMRHGDLMKQLRDAGYEAYAASVAPHDSAYDRACELYAQLFGLRTDYGKYHSELHAHERYGRDFSNRPLIPDMKKEDRLVLIGHSFGGATIRVFSDIYEKGVFREQEEEGHSSFFDGNKKTVFAVVAVAAPHNGTSAYDMYEVPSFDPRSVHSSLLENITATVMNKMDTPKEALPPKDNAAYDMHIDHALELNESLPLSGNIYYFSQPCCITGRQMDGSVVLDTKKTELMFLRSGRRIAAYKGKTKGGFLVDESWQESDGLVNTVSAAYPLSDKHKAFDPAQIPKGIWNVFDVYEGDHMALQGGLLHKQDILPYYQNLCKLIEKLAQREEQIL